MKEDEGLDQVRALLDQDVQVRDDLIDRLTSSAEPSTGAGTIAVFNMRREAITLGLRILTELEPSRDRSLALTKLEECLMWATRGAILDGRRSAFRPAQPVTQPGEPS